MLHSSFHDHLWKGAGAVKRLEEKRYSEVFVTVFPKKSFSWYIGVGAVCPYARMHSGSNSNDEKNASIKGLTLGCRQSTLTRISCKL